LPGNNVAYTRAVADGLCRVLDEGLWESFYHESLQRQGVKLVFDPDQVVGHRRPFDFWYFVRQRFHFCRSFAAMRLGWMSTPQRVKYFVGSMALPALLWLRGLLNVARRKRLVGRYLLCTPLIVTYYAAGAFGEMIGYLSGGGRSLEQVE
jgi:hypothetical protein